MSKILTRYQQDYIKDRLFLVTRDNAWIPMDVLRYIVHLRRLYKKANFKARRMLLEYTIRKTKVKFSNFNVTHGDFGHDPYNHIGRGMKA